MKFYFYKKRCISKLKNVNLLKVLKLLVKFKLIFEKTYILREKLTLIEIFAIKFWKIS